MINYSKSFLDAQIDVLVDGKPLKQYPHDNRLFIQANKGSEYEIRVKNNSNQRILAEFSIDGVNALSGKKSGDGAGYVISGKDSFTLKGFRVSDDKVNAFRFSNKSQSYAVKGETKDGKNVGVIGVVLFAEKIDTQIQISNNFWKELYEKEINKPKRPIIINPIRPWYDDDYYPPYYTPTNPWRPRRYDITWSSTSSTSLNSDEVEKMRCMNNSLGAGNLNSSFNGISDSVASASMQCSVAQDPKELFDIGTEFSDKEIVDKVKQVEFQRGEILLSQEIFYCSRESLLTLGVPILKETKINFPEAFPSQYCKKPE